MGVYVNGIYVPAPGETGWSDEVDDLLTNLAQTYINPLLAPFNADPTGATDSTAAIQAAIDATPEGGETILPPGILKFSHLELDRPITFGGAGFRATPNVAMGDSEWADLSNFAGTVLVCTATSGVGIECLGSGENRGWRLKDFLLLGPGTGTSVGISIGSTTVSVTDPRLENVQVSNFAEGWKFRNVYEMTAIALKSKGCATGLRVLEATNQNVFVNTQVQFSEDIGIELAAVANDVFYGGLIQNCTGTGVSMGGISNTLDGFHFENSAITHCIDAPWDGQVENFGAHRIAGIWMGGPAGDITLNLPQCTLTSFRHGGAEYDVILGTHGWATTLINAVGSLLTDGSTGGTQVIRNDVAGSYIQTPEVRTDALTLPGTLDVTRIETDNVVMGQWVEFQSAPSNGGLQFGPPGGPPDVYMWRVAANQVSLPAGDAFRCGSNIHASLPSAASYQAGMQYYCATHTQPIWSDGTNWVEADGTNH